MNAVVAALQGQERDTGFDLDQLQYLTDYWEDVRKRYDSFEAGIKSPATDIYRYEIPGGQYTNLKPQVESLGLGERFKEVKENYRVVNQMLGDIVKVTPSTKMVGDLAIFMTQNDLTPETIVAKGESLAFPDSAVSYFSGMMGQPAWGFPKDLQRVVLKGKEPITCRPGELLKPIDFDRVREEMKSFEPDPSWRAVLSYCLYPKVYQDYVKGQKEYGYVMRLGSHVFFHGLAVGETNQVNIADGKTLVIKYLGLGEVDDEGMRTVSFELNGIRRDVQVPDEEAQTNIVQVPMVDPEDKSQVGASIPGAVSKINVKKGDTVEENQTLVTRGHEDGDRHHRPDGRRCGLYRGDRGYYGESRPAAHDHQISRYIFQMRPPPGMPPGGGRLCAAKETFCVKRVIGIENARQIMKSCIFEGEKPEKAGSPSCKMNVNELKCACKHVQEMHEKTKRGRDTMKKFLSLLLAAVMMCSVLAACGSTGTTPSSQASGEEGTGTGSGVELKFSHRRRPGHLLRLRLRAGAGHHLRRHRHQGHRGHQQRLQGQH